MSIVLHIINCADFVVAWPYYRAMRAVLTSAALCGFAYKWTGRGPVGVIRNYYGVSAANRVGYGLVCLGYAMCVLDITLSILRLIMWMLE